MHIYFTFLTFILGLVLASFFNALLYRIDNGYKYPDIFIKGSHCEKCGKYLTVYELIPVISYFIFKGKCSKCGFKVPIYYPFSELLLGIGFGSIYYFSLSPTLYIILLFFFSFSYFDRIYKGIPQVLVNIFLILSVIYFFVILLIKESIPDNGLIIGIGLSVFILALSRIMKKPFGIGDILVLLGLSIFLNVSLYIGFVYIFLIITCIYAVVRVIFKKASFKTSIPLLPFMYTSLVLLFLSNDLISDLLEKIFFFL